MVKNVTNNFSAQSTFTSESILQKPKGAINMSESVIHTTTIQETDESIRMDHPSSVKLNDMIFSLLKDKSLQEIIDFGYRLLGNPPLLVAEGTLIASPPNCNFANSSFLDMIRKTDPGCREPIYLITEQEFKEKQQRSDAPLLINCKHLGLRLITAKVMYHDTNAAVLQLPESERKFGELDILYVHILAKFISSALVNPSLGNEFSNMLFRTKFLGLLEGADVLPNLNWIHILQEKESPTLCICVLRLAAQDSQPTAAELNGGYYFCKGISFAEDYVFLCTVNGNSQREIIFDHFSTLAKKYNGTVGISAEFTDSKRILPHYRQAKFALESGFALHGPGYAYDYKRSSVETICFEASCHIKTKRYFEPIYTLLDNSDKKKETVLSLTLQEYVSCNGDKAKTSQRLKLHRNTLSFRLHCIESILGWSISDDTSFYFLKIMEQLRKNQMFIERSGKQWNIKSNPQESFQPNN